MTLSSYQIKTVSATGEEQFIDNCFAESAKKAMESAVKMFQYPDCYKIVVTSNRNKYDWVQRVYGNLTYPLVIRGEDAAPAAPAKRVDYIELPD